MTLGRALPAAALDASNCGGLGAPLGGPAAMGGLEGALGGGRGPVGTPTWGLGAGS